MSENSTTDADAQPTDGIERDWDYVERIIRDLKIDGYKVSEFKSNTSNARPKKAFLLRVERPTDSGTGDEHKQI
jgi:hypothetical protein